MVSDVILQAPSREDPSRKELVMGVCKVMRALNITVMPHGSGRNNLFSEESFILDDYYRGPHDIAAYPSRPNHCATKSLGLYVNNADHIKLRIDGKYQATSGTAVTEKLDYMVSCAVIAPECNVWLILDGPWLHAKEKWVWDYTKTQVAERCQLRKYTDKRIKVLTLAQFETEFDRFING